MSGHSLPPTGAFNKNSPHWPIWPVVRLLLVHDSTGLSAKPLEPATSNGRTERGFVFLDGRYIAPPYAIEVTDAVINLNGHKLNATDLDLTPYATLPNREKWEQLNYELKSYRIDAVIVLFRGRKPMILDQTGLGARLIRILAGSQLFRQEDDEILESPLSDSDQVTWARLVSEFQPSSEFLARAREHLARLEAVRRTNEIKVAQNIWVGRIEYPLTAFAMVVVALAFGHLMSTRPCLDAALTTVSPSPRQSVFRSLLLVGALSVIDLVWTVVASDSVSMREMNPLGSQLIDEPLHLVAFKITTTTIVIGLLYRLHRFPIAQAASWWSCLVMALVAARWLTFGSMYL
jgi:hypothetical protein